MSTLCAEQGLHGDLLADAAAGVVWLRVTGTLAGLPELYQHLSRRWPQTILAACPTEVKTGLNVWGSAPVPLNLMQTIKQRFDPQNLLNPGRYLF
ncbi:MAG: hypothetical protein HC875_16740 [Anaerolineales bacterium]|nr:hypothetical protein [Anaerolineales bacterium]